MIRGVKIHHSKIEPAHPARVPQAGKIDAINSRDMRALLAHDRQFEDENPQLECQNHVD
jgi:hypothetical protein